MAINTEAHRVPHGRELTFDEAGSRAAFPHTLAVLNDYGQELRDRYREKLTESNHPTRLDTLRSTAEYLVEVNGVTLSVSLDLAHYWKYQEYNTGARVNAGSVPSLREAIKSWVMVKPVVPSGSGGRVPSVDSLAFLIARKIATEGTTGTHDLEHAQSELKPSFELQLDYAINFDLAENFDLIMQNFLDK